jgi:hypothetical protein
MAYTAQFGNGFLQQSRLNAAQTKLRFGYASPGFLAQGFGQALGRLRRLQAPTSSPTCASIRLGFCPIMGACQVSMNYAAAAS